MIRKLTISTCLLLLLSFNLASAATLMARVQPEQQKAEYWSNKPELKDIVLDKGQIEQLNTKIEKANLIFELDKFPATISGQELINRINRLDYYKRSLYVNGQLMTSQYKQMLLEATNKTTVPDVVRVTYGVTVRRTNVRCLPTAIGVYDEPKDTHFDLYQETVLDPSEPVVILHESKGGDFYFVQNRVFYGWVAKRDIAVVDSYARWIEYVQPVEFLVVLEPLLKVKAAGEEVSFQMGSRILAAQNKDKKKKKAEFLATIPRRSDEGKLLEEKIKISSNGSVNFGYLPYTREIIINQAFKFQGDPYGWGGLENSVDCSSMLQDIYRTVGVKLPRNGGYQERVPADETIMIHMNNAARYRVLRTLEPGAALFTPTHVMLYLGMDKGEPYAIHSMGSYGRQDAAGKWQRVPVMEVVVTDLLITNRQGKTFVDALTSVLDYK